MRIYYKMLLLLLASAGREGGGWVWMWGWVWIGCVCAIRQQSRVSVTRAVKRMKCQTQPHCLCPPSRPCMTFHTWLESKHRDPRHVKVCARQMVFPAALAFKHPRRLACHGRRGQRRGGERRCVRVCVRACACVRRHCRDGWRRAEEEGGG